MYKKLRKNSSNPDKATVYAESQLVSVNGDNNSHGSGSLIAGSNQVFANGIAVVNNTIDHR